MELINKLFNNIIEIGLMLMVLYFLGQWAWGCIKKEDD